MDLHGIVRGAIGAVNPEILCSIQQSTGYTKNAAFEQVPSYAAPVNNVSIQKQATTAADLRHLDALNIQGNLCTVYLEGAQYPVERITQTGGDLFTFNGQTWLVVAVLEMWADWCKLVLCQQKNPA
jgi:hypothetical protein